jgi:hypothetical protein
MRQTLGNETPDHGTVHGMARNRRLHRSGSSGLRSPILKRDPNVRIFRLRWSRHDSLLAVSALHAGENGGGHVLQKQGTREG